MFCPARCLRHRWSQAAKLGERVTRHPTFRCVECRPPIRSPCRDIEGDWLWKSGHFTCRDMWHHISRKKWWKSGKWPTSVERLATADESNRHLTTLLHTVKCEQTGCQPFSSDSYYFVLTFLNVHSSLPWRAKSTAKANTYVRSTTQYCADHIHTVLVDALLSNYYTYKCTIRTVVQMLT